MSLKVYLGRVFESVKRAEVAGRLRERGAQLVDAVTPQTDVVVLGGFGQTRRTRSDARRDAAARRAAEALGTAIWGEYALLARLSRPHLGPLGWITAPTTLEDGRSLTLVRVAEARAPEDFDPLLLDHFVAFVRAHVTVSPGDLDQALASWGDRAPFRAASGVGRDHICHPFTLSLLCSGDTRGGYVLREFTLNGAAFRSMVHIPASNSASFVFTPGGDLAWLVSELSPDHTVEGLGICALAQLGGTGDSLEALVEQQRIGPWEHGWERLLPQE